MMIDDLTNHLLEQGKSSHLEFIASVEPMSTIAATLCAFLNSNGGDLIVGVNPDGSPNGAVTKTLSKRLHEFLQEKISPQFYYDLSMDQTSKGEVISIGVPPGPDRHYVFDDAVYLRKEEKSPSNQVSLPFKP